VRPAHRTWLYRSAAKLGRLAKFRSLCAATTADLWVLSLRLLHNPGHQRNRKPGCPSCCGQHANPGRDKRRVFQGRELQIGPRTERIRKPRAEVPAESRCRGSTLSPVSRSSRPDRQGSPSNRAGSVLRRAFSSREVVDCEVSGSPLTGQRPTATFTSGSRLSGSSLDTCCDSVRPVGTRRMMCWQRYIIMNRAIHANDIPKNDTMGVCRQGCGLCSSSIVRETASAPLQGTPYHSARRGIATFGTLMAKQTGAIPRWSSFMAAVPSRCDDDCASSHACLRVAVAVWLSAWDERHCWPGALYG
jgi:hypothetical protein